MSVIALPLHPIVVRSKEHGDLQESGFFHFVKGEYGVLSVCDSGNPEKPYPIMHQGCFMKF